MENPSLHNLLLPRKVQILSLLFWGFWNLLPLGIKYGSIMSNLTQQLAHQPLELVPQGSSSTNLLKRQQESVAPSRVTIGSSREGLQGSAPGSQDGQLVPGSLLEA